MGLCCVAFVFVQSCRETDARIFTSFSVGVEGLKTNILEWCTCVQKFLFPHFV